MRRFVRRRSQRLIDLRAMLPYRPSQQHTESSDTHTIECQGIDPRPFHHRDQGRRDAQDADNNENTACRIVHV